MISQRGTHVAVSYAVTLTIQPCSASADLQQPTARNVHHATCLQSTSRTRDIL